MSGDATRTKAAVQARRNNTEQMLQRVRDALRQMRRDHIPAQTAMVARQAEVSRTFLYQNEQARKLLADADADERINAENRTLRLENRKLTTGNQQLTERIKAARENNRFLNTRIARLEADLAESLLAGQRAPAQPS